VLDVEIHAEPDASELSLELLSTKSYRQLLKGTYI